MEIPISEFQARVVRFQALLRQHNLDAGLVYYDELRSANGVYLSNWVPQFESGAILVPPEGEPCILGGPESEPFAKADATIKKTYNVPVFMVPDEEYPSARILSVGEVMAEALPGRPLRRLGVVGLGVMPHALYDGPDAAAQRRGTGRHHRAVRAVALVQERRRGRVDPRRVRHRGAGAGAHVRADRCRKQRTASLRGRRGEGPRPGLHRLRLPHHRRLGAADGQRRADPHRAAPGRRRAGDVQHQPEGERLRLVGRRHDRRRRGDDRRPEASAEPHGARVRHRPQAVGRRPHRRRDGRAGPRLPAGVRLRAVHAGALHPHLSACSRPKGPSSARAATSRSSRT